MPGSTDQKLIQPSRNVCYEARKEVVRFWWCLTLTFDLERKLATAWKLRVRFDAIIYGNVSYFFLQVTTLDLYPSPPLDNIRVMMIVWRLLLRGNIIRTALCWWHNVHSQQHTYTRSSYRSNRLGLSRWDLYAVRRGCCLEFYYCNMVEWFWWDSSLISTTNWFPWVLWHCWFGHRAFKNWPRNDLWR